MDSTTLTAPDSEQELVLNGTLDSPRREISPIRFDQPPPELLHLIFSWSVAPSYLLDSSFSRGPHSPWFQALRFKKAIVRVCRAWHAIGTMFLYEEVTLYRIGQVAAFLQALEASPMHGSFVKKITVSPYVPRRYAKSFSDKLQRVLRLCPRLVHFAALPTIVFPSTTTLPMVHTPVTQLDFNENVDYSSLLPVLMQVRDSLLSLSLSPWSTEGLRTPLHFAQLKSLRCGLSYSGALHIIQEAWSMPSLERLTFGWELERVHSTMIPLAVTFCKSLGGGLKYLHLAPNISSSDWSLQEILDACPNLEHLVVSRYLDLPYIHPNVKWIDIWTSTDSLDQACAWRKGVADALKGRKDILPAFQFVRFLREGLPAPFEIPFLLPPHETMFADVLHMKYPGLHICYKDGLVCDSSPGDFDWDEIDNSCWTEWGDSDVDRHSSEESDWDTVTDENSDEESDDGDLDIYAPSLSSTEDFDDDA